MLLRQSLTPPFAHIKWFGGLERAVSYTPPWILVESSCSPHFIHGVHLQSTICPPPVLLQSPPLPVHSSWTPHGVHMESRWSGLEVDFGLSQIQGVTEWSPGGLHVESRWTGPCGVLVESIRTQGMFHKMHPQGIEHTISCIECLCKQQLPLPLDHRS